MGSAHVWRIRCYVGIKDKAYGANKCWLIVASNIMAAISLAKGRAKEEFTDCQVWDVTHVGEVEASEE